MPTIRDASPADLGEIHELIHDLAVYERLEHQLVAEPGDLEPVLFGSDSVATVSVVESEDGSIVGMALWFRTYSTFLGATGIWLEDLFVRERDRGNGYGRALLDHLRGRTTGRLEWAVLDWNAPSIGFYESLGARAIDGWTTYRWDPSS